MKIKNLIFLYIISASSLIFANSVPKIFIENHYGAPIVCKVNNQKEILLKTPYPEFIGYAQTMESIMPGSISSLDIWTTGYLSQTKSLQEFLTKISAESPAHPNQNAVLIIHPSSYLSAWNITLNWQREDSGLTEFRMKTPEEKFLTIQSAQERLDAIIFKEVLGADIAQKASAICRAKYVYVNAVNLCENLKRNLVKPEYFVDPARKGIQPLPAPTIAEIKETINRLYRSLQTYIKNGWVQ